MSYSNSFVSFYASKNDLNYRDAESHIKNFFLTLIEHTKIMGITKISNFGTFSLKKYTRKYAINPKNPDMLVSIVPHNMLKFKPNKQTKQFFK